MKRSLASLIALAVLFVFMNGCSTFKAYEGPELPDSELATIRGYFHWWLLYYDVVEISCVDGKCKANNSELKVLPGLHWIMFKSEIVIIGQRNLTCGMEIETKAGHEYHIVSYSLVYEGWSSIWSLNVKDCSLKRGFVQIEDRLSGSSLGKMRIPTERSRGLICRTDDGCPSPKRCINEQSGFMFGVCSPPARDDYGYLP